MIKRNIIAVSKQVLPYSLRLNLRKANWKWKYFLQKSKKNQVPYVICPIENKKYQCFIPEVNGVWRSEITPGNGARSRHRLIWLFLKQETQLFTQPSTLLHIAPEHCYFEQFVKIPHLNYLPGDKMVVGYGKQSGVEYMDLLDLPQKDRTIDYVLCNQVLEHIPDDMTAIKEMYRVLKPGGEAIVTVPIREDLEKTYENESIITPQERTQHFGQWDHVRWYGKDVIERFKAVGFSVSLIRHGEQFTQEEYQRYGLCDELIIHAKK